MLNDTLTIHLKTTFTLVSAMYKCQMAFTHHTMNEHFVQGILDQK